MKVVVEHSQVDCSNKECQREFKKKLGIEEEKRIAMKQKKEADSLVRKENMIRARKSKKTN